MQDDNGTRAALQKKAVLCAVIHWGRQSDTEACVRSLLTQTGVERRVVVIDNGSGDDLDAMLAGLPVAVERIAENTGFTGGANRAMELARAAGVAWCWILNNDTTVDSADTLSRLMAFVDSTSAVVVSPVLRNVVDGKSRDSGWSLFCPALALTVADDGGLVATACRRFSACHRFISGTAWLVRVADAPSPLLDQRFFAYFEDVDLALRLGVDRLAVASDVRITHHVSGSTGGSLLKFRFKAANLVYLMHKHGLAGRAFAGRYAAFFVLSEWRRYWRTPAAFCRTAREAWREGLAKHRQASHPGLSVSASRPPGAPVRK